MPIPSPFDTNRPHLIHPKPFKPLLSLGDYDIYHIDKKLINAKLHPNLPKTPLWMYVNSLHTATVPVVIEAWRNKPSVVIWHNKLPTTEFPFVDNSVAMTPHSTGNHCGGYMPAIGDAVVHLHGAEVLPQFDGVPTSPLTPGDIVPYWYPNQQRAATLWFHDHTMDHTAKNVYSGLSGVYFLRDEEEAALNLPKDDYEWPLVLQDRKIDAMTGQLIYETSIDTPEFVGDVSLVNGQICPLLNAEPTWYRFRLVNGSNARFYNLKFHVGSDDVNGDVNQKPDIDMWQIGTDGGLLSKAAKVPSPAPGLSQPQAQGLLIGPGERIDLLVNFERIANTTVSLYSDIPAPFADFANDPPEYFHVMAFNVGQSASVQVQFDPNIQFSNIDPLPASGNSQVYNLNEMPGTATTPPMPYIDIDGNPLSYCDAITPKEQIPLNKTQDFTFDNQTGDSHPMHIHLIQFQVVSGGPDLRDIDDNPVLAWKDTVRVIPGQQTVVRAKFAPFKGRYVYHCHILEHEDAGMMRPLEVI